MSANQLIDGVVNENSILAKKIQQLHIFFSLLIPDINHEERQLLDEALIRTYAKKGITHNNESLIDPDHPDRYREMPLLGDVYEILMESPETKRMGNILNRLVNGSAKTFNQHTNVQLDNLYTVLDTLSLQASCSLWACSLLWTMYGIRQRRIAPRRKPSSLMRRGS